MPMCSPDRASRWEAPLPRKAWTVSRESPNLVDEGAEPEGCANGPLFGKGGTTSAGKGICQDAEDAAQQEGREQETGSVCPEDARQKAAQQEKDAGGEEIMADGQVQEKGSGRDSGREMECQRLYASRLCHFLTSFLRKY